MNTKTNLKSSRSDHGALANGVVHPGVLIINADDWGRDQEVTDRTLECVEQGTVSSVSAMVFMQDSERAADLARTRGIDAGLHLNLTTSFTSEKVPAELKQQQDRLMRWLRSNRLAPTIFHLGLKAAFEDVVASQLDEYRRLYGISPRRIDGHHHMHLCANVLWQQLLPARTVIRRNYTFRPGEKGWLNRSYRAWQDRGLARRHSLTDYFFSLPPLSPAERLEGIFALAEQSVVELECHPINGDEHRFLTGGGLLERLGNRPIALSYRVA